MGHAMAQKSTNVIGIAAVAALAGAVTALLFAPKSGEEMRSDIKDRAQRAKDASKDKMQAAKGKMARMKGKAADKMEEMTDEMSEHESIDEYGRW
jgi:gas vesicle protein